METQRKCRDRLEQCKKIALIWKKLSCIPRIFETHQTEIQQKKTIRESTLPHAIHLLDGSMYFSARNVSWFPI